MSAAELRRAASLMRERAESVALTAWFCTTSHEERYDGYDVWTHDGSTHWTVATADFSHVADHIASWHPAVALAVADWLDSTANDVEHVHTPVYNLTSTTVARALTVARAYLGADQ